MQNYKKKISNACEGDKWIGIQNMLSSPVVVFSSPTSIFISPVVVFSCCKMKWMKWMDFTTLYGTVKVL